jgi:tRNA(fMet)-specific endonuclease VapC
VKYLLDTNACVSAINGQPASVRARLEHEVRRSATIHVPSIVVFELWYGVAKSAQSETNRRRLVDFFGGKIEVLPFEGDDARTAGDVRAVLEQSGRPIGPYDVLIAGQALARDLILVTANHREFGRIKGLRWEDWAAPHRS